jgi:galactokinase
MDQLCAAAAQADHALLIDCRSLETRAVPIPEGCEVLIAHSGQARALSESGYARRRHECEQAESVIGPLRDASLSDLDQLDDPVLRRRARHVLTENQRVLDTVECLASGDLGGAGALMSESHASLGHDFEVSTPALDAAVAALQGVPGVLGARLTGAGFGGCVVALAEQGTSPPMEVWRVRAAGAATVEDLQR